MIVDAYASLPHYWAHLAPIMGQLADRHVGGAVWASNGSRPWGLRLPASIGSESLTLVASWGDYLAAAERSPGRRFVYVEHGAGQIYRDRADHPAFSAGGVAHRDSRIVAYVAPSEIVAERWRAARPGVPVCAAGCTRITPGMVLARGIPRGARRVVALAFHWPNTLCPEAGWALPHYERALPEIVAGWRAAGWDVIGHGHPKAWNHLRPMWARLGVDVEPDGARVLTDADVLVADNTSLMYEFAALGGAVVALNTPAYRRNVSHGLRFWMLVPGPQVDSPAELAALPLDEVVASGGWAAVRRGVSATVYAHCDGSAASRAAGFIIALEDSHA